MVGRSELEIGSDRAGDEPFWVTRCPNPVSSISDASKKRAARTNPRAAMTPAIRKYPRTRHLVGSGLQPGDQDLDAVPVSELRGKNVVIEEKMDGANCGISFGPDFGLLLQSRGHSLT